MTYTDNSINILTTKTYKGIGRAWIIKNLKGNESIEKIISLINNNSKQDDLITVNDFEYAKREIEKKLIPIEDWCDGLIALGDNKFPRCRGDVKDSERPIFLFYKGNIDLLNIENSIITVIGLLNPSEEIEAREQKMVAEITQRNVTILSGLALGCDTIAHKQALKSGKTIAILPSTLNTILPSKNKDLAEDIVKNGGVLVSEYFEEFKSKNELNTRYKERDRLQALFCDTIILAASYAQDSANRWKLFDQKLDSGARLAMEYAKEYNIPRAIMYDHSIDFNNPMFDLNRQLLNDDKKSTIITQKTLEEIINRINIKKLNRNNDNIYQTNLFN